ncbi:MAG: SDR family oxidoreductase [Acidobacteriota bacterium]|nr:SDR family oxidoreductase [Acidobacteriota bacterium]
MSDFDSIVITGASTGIGRACALRFHRLGWRVFAGVRRVADGAALVAETSDRLTPVVIDVTRAETIAAAAAQISAAVGERGLAALVNNAGIGVGGPVEGLDLDKLRHQFEVNLFGQVAVTQALLPLLRAARGRIVNMSSMGGKVSQPFMAPYCGSKHALEAFTDSLREELKPWGMHVAAIEPGVISTPIWDKARAEATDARAAAPAHITALYGAAAERVGKVLGELPKRGIPADRVAAAVEHAVTAPRPRTRYPVGTDARIALLLRRLLGDRAFYWLMGRLAGRPR